MPKKFITDQEVDFIRQHCLSKSDEAIAKELNRDIRTIKSARKKLGIRKLPAGKVQSVHETPANGYVGQNLNEDQRKEFFKTQLVNSLVYQNLKEQLTTDEIDFYLEEWAALAVQFDDIVNTEKRQIDEFIKAEIMGNRMLRNIKVSEDNIEVLIKELEDHRKSNDVQNDLTAQERDMQLMTMIRSIHSQTQVMANDYQKNVDLKNKLLNELNARRRDRVEQIKRGGTTFIGLIEAFRDRQLRDTQGRHMELVRLAKEKKKGEWNRPITFPDGTKDCILMDESSIIPKREIVLLNEEKFKLINKYIKLSNLNILVIDDNSRRKNFFSNLFKNHKVDFASNFLKTLASLSEKPYNLILIDYDLGMDEKGSKITNYILNKNLCKDSDFVVISMNIEGAEELFKMLTGQRNVDKNPFEEVFQNFKD